MASVKFVPVGGSSAGDVRGVFCTMVYGLSGKGSRVPCESPRTAWVWLFLMDCWLLRAPRDAVARLTAPEAAIVPDAKLMQETAGRGNRPETAGASEGCVFLKAPARANHRKRLMIRTLPGSDEERGSGRKVPHLGQTAHQLLKLLSRQWLCDPRKRGGRAPVLMQNDANLGLAVLVAADAWPQPENGKFCPHGRR